MASEILMPGPMCLTENLKGQLTAKEEALRILSAIEQPVVVVAIVGLYPTGKSYLMNKLAGKNTVERVKPEAAQATVKMQEEIQQQNEHLLVQKEKTHEEHIKQLNKKNEKTQALLREIQQQTEQFLQQEKCQEEGMKLLTEKMEKVQAQTKNLQLQNEQLLQQKEKTHKEP
ncbi:guanylate-binding protein 1-like isoform X1 [Sigmodon hispidus]